MPRLFGTPARALEAHGSGGQWGPPAVGGAGPA